MFGYLPCQDRLTRALVLEQIECHEHNVLRFWMVGFGRYMHGALDLIFISSHVPRATLVVGLESASLCPGRVSLLLGLC